MKHIHYIYIGAFAFLIACSSEERITTDSNEKPSGPIVLSAGIVEGSSKATTRTVDGNHAYHLALTTSTQLALQVSGTWIGHGSGTVVQTTTATVGAETPSESKHNALTCNPTLYWDDYGTADDNNTSGRATGLTIYGAAIDSKTTAPTVNNWSALSWTLSANQTASGETPADKDLLISNNVKTGNDGTYLFADRASGKLLEFTHALSKITVVLTAGAGFVGDVFDATTQEEVILTSNDATTNNDEWPLITGNVNISNGIVDITSSGCGTRSTIIMHEVSNTNSVVTKDALVMPGSHFSADNAIIARINADGNIYYVTAQNIRTAMRTANPSTNYKTEAGKNYIINVTVDKTGISDVTATVTAWSDVVAAAVAPKINVTANWGSENAPLGTLLDGDYSFYRSKYVGDTSIRNGYGTISGELEGEHYYAGESTMTKSSSTWTMSPTLYWPDHNTHYQFRCVWPNTVITTGNGTGGDGILDNPRVTDGSGALDGYQVIKVKNVAYSSGTFPSDLMIARPEIQDAYGNLDNTITCNNSDHNSVSLYDAGICATEGNIKLSFRYMMSQVEVNLSTTGNSDPNYVNLSNATVELISVYNYGYVKLGDRTVDFTGYSRGNYILDTVEEAENANKRWSAIVPQTFSSTKFKITIHKNGDPEQGIDDIYYADISDFTTGGWTAGNHYVYNLTVTKTDVQVSATLTNWNTVNANHSIWF